MSNILVASYINLYNLFLYCNAYYFLSLTNILMYQRYSYI